MHGTKRPVQMLHQKFGLHLKNAGVLVSYLSLKCLELVKLLALAPIVTAV